MVESNRFLRMANKFGCSCGNSLYATNSGQFQRDRLWYATLPSPFLARHLVVTCCRLHVGF